MDFFQGLMLLTVVHLLAAASPGPDFVMVTQQTLTNGRNAGLLVSFGIALGLSVHILYSSLGLAEIARATGYSSQSRLTEAVVRNFGTTPGLTRRAWRERS